MATFYTARKGFKRGEKTLEAAMKKAIDKDVIEINQHKLNLDVPIEITGGVTIEGSPDKPRPTLVAKDRQNALFIAATQSGTVTLRHLDLQLGESALGIRCNAKNITLILDDVQIYHHDKVTTPYNALIFNTQGMGRLTVKNSLIDALQADAQVAEFDHANIGDWYMDNSQLIVSQASFTDSAIQNILVVGHDATSQAQLRTCLIGGDTRFDHISANANKLSVSMLPSITHKSKFGNSKGDATGLIVGPGAKMVVNNLKQVDPTSQHLNVKSTLSFPKWRALGLIGGSLTIVNGYLHNANLKNVAWEGDLTLENVTDDSQWDVKPTIKISNRNSQSMLFDAQSKLKIDGAEDEVNAGGQKPALNQLDEMIGLSNVKDEVRRIVGQAQANAERRRRGLADNETKMRLHMVFAGNPGTGKTVVARLVGQALYEAGVLKTTKFVEVRQSGLVSEYVGKTAQKTEDVVKSALDGVLFIDEAYELAPPKNGDSSYNNEAVTELIADMENYSDRLVVIMAGYTQEMSDFFTRGNSGLASRINNWIEFPDYSVKQLKQIERLDLQKSGARIANKQTLLDLDAGIDKLLPVMSRGAHGSGNGRFVGNYVQKVTSSRDDRIAMSGNMAELSDEQLMIIEPQDVTNAVQLMIKQNQDMQQ